MRKILSLAPAVIAGIGLAALSGATAQEKFPSKPIEVVTHAGVGGGTDITARMVMVQAPAEFGQELVVVNKTGGSGAAALGYAAGRPKDGRAAAPATAAAPPFNTARRWRR